MHKQLFFLFEGLYHKCLTPIIKGHWYICCRCFMVPTQLIQVTEIPSYPEAWYEPIINQVCWSRMISAIKAQIWRLSASKSLRYSVLNTLTEQTKSNNFSTNRFSCRHVPNSTQTGVSISNPQEILLATFTYNSAQSNGWITSSACHHVQQRPGNGTIIWFRCAGAGMYLKAA